MTSYSREELADSVALVLRFIGDREGIAAGTIDRNALPVAVCAARDGGSLSPPQAVIDAIELLADRLDSVNRAFVSQMAPTLVGDDTTWRWEPITRVGIYVPFRLPSTAFTLLSAAHAAGVPEIIVYLAQQPGSQNLHDPVSEWIAHRYGASVRVGPARFGFPTLALGIQPDGSDRCALVAGPCGRRLNLVKQLSCLIGGATSDMSAGPSELAIVLDPKADPAQAIRDVLAQLEHGPDSRADIISVRQSDDKAGVRFEEELSRWLPSDRVTITRANSVNEALAQVRAIGPETCELLLENAHEHLPDVRCCGVAYAGLPSTLGDYGAIGRGCADPTGGAAKAESGLSPLTFMRMTATVAGEASPELMKAAEAIALYEQLAAHAAAVS